MNTSITTAPLDVEKIGAQEFLELPPPIATIVFDSAWRLLVPRSGGVYLIHDLRGPLYVGRSANLRRRFDEHLVWSHNEALRHAMRFPFGVVQYSWFDSGDVALGDLERHLINFLGPACNIQLVS